MSDSINFSNILIYGILIRFFLVFYAEYQDTNGESKYTDIDYEVIILFIYHILIIIRYLQMEQNMFMLDNLLTIDILIDILLY